MISKHLQHNYKCQLSGFIFYNLLSLLGLLARLGQLFLLFRKAVEEPTYSPLQSPHNQSTKNLPSGPHRDLVGSIILLGFVLCDTLSLTFYSSKIVPIHHILPKSHYPKQNSYKPFQNAPAYKIKIRTSYFGLSHSTI